MTPIELLDSSLIRPTHSSAVSPPTNCWGPSVPSPDIVCLLQPHLREERASDSVLERMPYTRNCAFLAPIDESWAPVDEERDAATGVNKVPPDERAKGDPDKRIAVAGPASFVCIRGSICSLYLVRTQAQGGGSNGRDEQDWPAACEMQRSRSCWLSGRGGASTPGPSDQKMPWPDG